MFCRCQLRALGEEGLRFVVYCPSARFLRVIICLRQAIFSLDVTHNGHLKSRVSQFLWHLAADTYDVRQFPSPIVFIVLGELS